MISLLNFEMEIYGLILLIAVAGGIWILVATKKIAYQMAELDAALAVADITGRKYLVRLSKVARHEYLISCYEAYCRPTRIIPYIAYLNMIAHTGDLRVNLR